jgi:hypothetical protein
MDRKVIVHIARAVVGVDNPRRVTYELLYVELAVISRTAAYP